MITHMITGLQHPSSLEVAFETTVVTDQQSKNNSERDLGRDNIINHGRVKWDSKVTGLVNYPEAVMLKPALAINTTPASKATAKALNRYSALARPAYCSCCRFSRGSTVII
jgi:hypothetical protein